MKILCPQCGVKGSADDSYCDRKVKCPKCDTIFLVQTEMALEQEIPLPATASVIDDPVLESELIEKPGVEADPEDEGYDGQVIEEEAVEVLDLSDLSAEIDQQIREGVGETQQTSEVSEESLELLEDPQEIDYSEQTDSTAGLVEAGAEIQETEKIQAEDSRDEAGAVGGTEHAAVEQEPYGLAREQCWQCGKEDSAGEPFIAKEGRLYCTDCLPDESAMEAEESTVKQSHVEQEVDSDVSQGETPHYNFTIMEVIKEAWDKTKGAKGAIWGASAIMYLVTLVLFAGGALIFPTGMGGMIGDMKSLSIGLLQQLVTSIISVIFTAGLLYMGIRKVVGDPISWKMVGKGFSSAGSLIVATILQFILVAIGFCLLVLPGIYLLVGYFMTLPLIVDKGMSPWQAMETSRKTIHTIWWKVFGLFFVMWLICLLSAIPLGIGLIWTWPMCIILMGVVYCYLFGSAKVEG